MISDKERIDKCMGSDSICCPYCGVESELGSDAFEKSDRHGITMDARVEVECKSCERTFNCSRNIRITYFSCRQVVRDAAEVAK